MILAAETLHFKIAVSGIERIGHHGRGLCWPLKAQHAIVPRFACQPIGFYARVTRALCRGADAGSTDGFSRLCAHTGTLGERHRTRQAARFSCVDIGSIVSFRFCRRHLPPNIGTPRRSRSSHRRGRRMDLKAVPARLAVRGACAIDEVLVRMV